MWQRSGDLLFPLKAIFWENEKIIFWGDPGSEKIAFSLFRQGFGSLRIDCSLLSISFVAILKRPATYSG